MQDVKVDALHKLIIPNTPYCSDYLLDRNMISSAYGGQVGVLAAGLIPFKDFFKTNNFKDPSIKNKGDLAMVRYYYRALLPLRLISLERRVKIICKLSVKAYETYFETDGRPNVIDAQDIIYAGIIAKRLNLMYGIPYEITVHKPLRPQGIHVSYKTTLMREVLEGATAVRFASSGLYNQFVKEFGDLDAVKLSYICPN